MSLTQSGYFPVHDFPQQGTSACRTAAQYIPHILLKHTRGLSFSFCCFPIKPTFISQMIDWQTLNCSHPSTHLSLLFQSFFQFGTNFCLNNYHLTRALILRNGFGTFPLIIRSLLSNSDPLPRRDEVAWVAFVLLVDRYHHSCSASPCYVRGGARP